MPRTGARGWWRDFFLDHPGLIARIPEAYTGVGLSAKAKVYCAKCFDRDIAAVQEEAQPPQRQVVREISEI
jgi:hypothetical protein